MWIDSEQSHSDRELKIITNAWLIVFTLGESQNRSFVLFFYEILTLFYRLGDYF